MDLKGLVVSQADSKDTSAYTHRVRNLAACLVKRSIALGLADASGPNE